MWTMWDAPSDRDYYGDSEADYYEHEENEPELPVLQPVTAKVKMVDISESKGNDECPF